MRKQQGPPTAPSHYAGLVMTPFSSFPVGSVPLLDSLCQGDHWRNDLLYQRGDIERHPGPELALFLKQNDLIGMLPTAARRCDEAVSEFKKCLRVTNIYEPEESISHDPILIQNACLCAARLFVTSWPPRTSVFVQTCLLHATPGFIHGSCRQYGGRMALAGRTGHLPVCLEHCTSAGGRFPPRR